LLAVVVAVVTIATLYFAREILIPIAFAGLLAFILTPLAHLLERVRLGRVFSSLLVVLLAVATIGAIGWTITKQLTNVVEQMPDYQQNILNKVEALRGAPTQALDKAANAVNEVKQRLSAPPTNESLDATTLHARKLPVPKAPVPVQLVKTPSLPLDSLQNAFGLLVGAGLVFVFTLFMIVRREDLRNRFLSLVGTGHLRTATEAMDDAAARVSRYLRIQLFVNTCYGIVIGAGLHFIGLPGALLWGVIAGILRFVPYLGPPLGGIGPVLLSVAIFPGWQAAIFTLALYAGVEATVSQFAEPMLYGERTGLSPVAVLLAAVFWTTLWGPLGLVMSTPLTTCLLVLGRRVPRLAFLHKLLGDEPVLTPEAHFYQRMLALDSQEAREVLESNLKNHSLEEVYESVLIPALALAEQDRHNNAFDDYTERFIYENTKELVEEIYQSRNHTDEAHNAAQDQEHRPAKTGSRQKTARLHVVCVPARDEADEIVGIMLAQILQRGGYKADAVSLRALSDMLTEVQALKPDVVCISALPPYAISHARLVYSRLHEQWPELRVIVSLWNFTGDLRLAINRIGLNTEGSILTSLSQVVQTVGLASEFVPQNAHVGLYVA
jgi:predicted PurR-regulated permease PerM